MGKKTTIYEDGTTSEIELSDTEKNIIEYAFFDEQGELCYLREEDRMKAEKYLLALQLLYLYRCKSLSQDDLMAYFDLFVKKYFIYVGYYMQYCIMKKDMGKVDYNISIYDIDESNAIIKKYLITKFKEIGNWKTLNLDDILINFNKENNNLKILGGVVSCYFDLMAEFGKNQPKDESYYKDSKKYNQITITVRGEEVKFFYTDDELLKANFDDNLMKKINTYYVDNVSPYPARERATIKKIICTLFYDTLPKWKVYIEDGEYEEYTVVPIEKKRFNFDKYVDFLNTVSLDTILEIKETLFELHSKCKNTSKVRTKQLEKFLSYIEERKEKEYLNIYGSKIEVLKKYSNALLKSNESCCNFYVGRAIPDKQLKNAISSLDKSIDIDTVIGLYDTTLWNSGKRGYIFTNEAVYFKELIGRTKSFCYREVEHIKIISKNGKEINELHFVLSSGKTIAMTDTFINKLAFKQCVEELAKLSTES